MNLPVEDDTKAKPRRAIDGEIRRKRMFVPAEKNTVGHGLDIHVRASGRRSVVSGVLDHFFVEPCVLTPAGHGIERFEIEGKAESVNIAMNHFGREMILFLLPEFFGDKKL